LYKPVRKKAEKEILGKKDLEIEIVCKFKKCINTNPNKKSYKRNRYYM